MVTKEEQNVRDTLTLILEQLRTSKDYLNKHKANVQLYTAYNALKTAIFWLEAYIK